MSRVRTKRGRTSVMSLRSLWKIYRDTVLRGAPDGDVQLAHDAYYGAILAYCKALNHVLEEGDLEAVAESIRKLAATTALAQELASGPTH